jgi:hypothetical protein
MRIRKNPQPVPVIVNVYVHIDKPDPPISPQIDKAVEASVEAQAEVKKLGIFNPKIDYSYTVDAKFFNDQIKNTISLSVVAIAGIALFRSEACGYLEKFGGIFLIIFSLWLFVINACQTLKALAETWKHKWGGQKSLKLVLTTISLIAMLLGAFWGLTGLWQYGLSSTNLLKLPDVCKLSTTTSQTNQAK